MRWILRPTGATPRRAAFFALYLAAVALFLEGGSRAFLACSPCFLRVAGEDDPSWRLQWVGRKRTEGISYGIDVYHPRRGWALRSLLDRRAYHGRGRLSSDGHGIRGARENPLARVPGRRRIVVLGDSYTFGEEVSDDETYAARLEALLSDTDVLNLGVHGYGHDQMLLTLREDGVRYQPDVVLLGFVAMDMPRNTLSFRDYAKPWFVLEGGRLALRGTPVPTPEEVLAAESRRSRFLDLLRMLAARVRERGSAAERITAALLAEIAGTARWAGATPVFVYLPVGAEMRPGPPLPGESFLLAEAGRLGVAATSRRPLFLERIAKGARFRSERRPTVHWGPEEHQLAAEGIAALLREQGLDGAGEPPPASTTEGAGRVRP